ncbi:MAG: hypothetical protein RLW42_04935 [Gammaproteobacteria bacterium]
MSTRLHACATAAALFTLSTTTASHAATLIAYAFEDGDGSFVTTPDVLDDALGETTLDVTTGTLGEVGGNPGRALRLNGFTSGNTLTLRATLQAGWQLRVTRIGFDQRASASGPSTWSLALGDDILASGATSSDFTSVSEALDVMLGDNVLTVAISGDGASSALGTLRIDNLFVEGVAQPVPLPPPAVLAAAPLLATLRRRRRVRRAAGRPTRATRRAAGNTVPA